MWKNNKPGKELNLYITYRIEGLNQDKLINYLQKKDIELKDIKKTSRKKMKITIKYTDEKKFFAITENMCYNIKKEKYSGKAYPVFLLVRNFGLLLGAVFFIALSIISNDYIFSIEYTGSGKAVSTEIASYLEKKGIKKYDRFSDIDLAVLGDEILSSSNNLSFVQCNKQGNRLIIELVLANNYKKERLGLSEKISSEVDGRIESIKVYRGTAVVNIGDPVKKGDLLVDGYALIKDNVVSVNPIAFISIISTVCKEYVSKNDNDEISALIFAENTISDYEITDAKVSKTKNGENYIYKVCLNYRYIIYK